MRIDEWQRYLESQFVDDPGPVAHRTTPTATACTANGAEVQGNITEMAPTNSPNSDNWIPQRTQFGIRLPQPNPASAHPRIPESPHRNAEDAERDSIAVQPPHGPFSVLMPMVPLRTAHRDGVCSADAVAAEPMDAETTPVPTWKTSSRRTRRRSQRPILTTAANLQHAVAPLSAAVPQHVQKLLELGAREAKCIQEIAQTSYKQPFQETRQELIERLLDPVLSLEETARLLNVCPTTVRRYTNRGTLNYYRKETNGGLHVHATARETRQRRFRLSDVLAFLDAQERAQVDSRAS